MKTASQTRPEPLRNVSGVTQPGTHYATSSHSIPVASRYSSMAAVLLAFLIQASTASWAISRKQADTEVHIVHALTDNKALTGPEEVRAIEAIWTEYYKEHPPTSFWFGIGQIAFDGSFPVDSFAAGTQGTFTFEFINTVTLQQQSGGPTIGYVLYEESPHDGQPYFPIGISSNPSNNFAFDFAMPSGEPSFEGIPFDTTGHPIVSNDFDGSGNVAIGEYFNIPVPEPSTLALAGTGFVGLSGLLRKRLRPRA
jgi:hypothetical protein